MCGQQCCGSISLANESVKMVKILLLLISLFRCSVTIIYSQNLPAGLREKSNQDLLVLTVLPYEVPGNQVFQPSYSAGPALYIAIEIAAEMINNRTDILDGYMIKLLRENGGCNIPNIAIEGLVRGLSLGKNNPHIVGMIGPSCSISSTSVAPFVGRKEVSLLNIYSGGSPKLGNHKKYPFSFSILDSVDVIAETLVALIKHNSWKNISVFYESCLYYSTLFNEFNQELEDHNARSKEEVRIEHRAVNSLHVLRVRSIKRVIIFMVSENILKEMVCRLHHIGIKFPNYLFIAAGLEDFYPLNVTVRNMTCTAEKIAEVMATSVLINFQLENSKEKEIKFSEKNLVDFKEIYKQRIEEVNIATGADIKSSREGAIYFDALWSLALALNNSMDKVDLPKYYFLGQQNSTKIIRSELLKVDYEGLSGRIRFNKITGRVEQNVTISIFKENGEKIIAHYSRTTKNITAIPLNYTNIFISDQFGIQVKTIPEPFTLVVLMLAVVAFVVTLVLHSLTLGYRKHKSVKASSIKLNQLSFISCYMFIGVMLFNSLFHGLANKISTAITCGFQHGIDISLSVVLTMLFGTATLRTWRLYRIFVHFENPGKFLSNKFLLGTLGALVFVDLLLVVPGFFINPYEAVFKDITPEENTDAVLIKIMICYRDNFDVWFYCSQIVNTTLMVTLLVLTILTRKIAQKNFKTKLIMFQLYFMTFILPIFLTLYHLFYFTLTPASNIAQFIILSLLILSLVVILNVTLFLPPLLQLRQ